MTVLYYDDGHMQVIFKRWQILVCYPIISEPNIFDGSLSMLIHAREIDAFKQVNSMYTVSEKNHVPVTLTKIDVSKSDIRLYM